MTKIKKFWIALITAILCLATFAFAGCNKGGGNTDGGDVFDDTTSYVFVIEDQDGNPLSGYKVILCRPGSNCYNPSQASNANGKLTGYAPNGAEVCDIHLIYGTSSKYLSYEGPTQTPANYCTITLVVTL